MTQLFPHIVIWAVLTAAVVFLAIYRRKIGLASDESLHVLDAEQSAVAAQAATARKLAVIDRWGKLLTILSVLYLLVIAAIYLYGALADQSIKMS
ncbi:MAG: hypothetical protein ACM336_14980 [Acidobacteriota bacterium]